MDRKAPAKRKPILNESEAPPRRNPVEFGTIWSLAFPLGHADLHSCYVELLRWNIFQFGTKRKPDLPDFRKTLLPAGEWIIEEEGVVVMFGHDREPWLQRRPDGTIECANPDYYETIRQSGVLGELWEPHDEFEEPPEDWEPPDTWKTRIKHRLYYDENAQDEATMQQAGEGALRAWGMPVPTFGGFTDWAVAIEAETGA
jgi:hypothetical protein